MKLDTKDHSVFRLNYHLVFVVKYRRKVLDDKVSARLKTIFEDIGKNYHVYVKEWNHDIDHVHVLFKGETMLLNQNMKCSQ